MLLLVFLIDSRKGTTVLDISVFQTVSYKSITIETFNSLSLRTCIN